MFETITDSVLAWVVFFCVGLVGLLVTFGLAITIQAMPWIAIILILNAVVAWTLARGMK
jgi:hypothetical protein